MPDVLNPRQRQILDFLKGHAVSHPYPPTVREIGLAVGLSSSSTVHMHLNALEKKGYIHRDPTKSRAVEIVGSTAPSPAFSLPLVGRVAAGAPILAEPNIEDHITLGKEIAGSEDAFCLTVHGDSMINVGIYEGDMVVVRPQREAPANGTIVVARIENPDTGESEVTVKRFYREAGKIRLQPENDAYQPIYSANPVLEGVVVAVIRLVH